MSLPSYSLSKSAAGVWICVGEMPSGRPFRFEAGSGSRDKAEGIVEGKLRQKVASSTGSKARWARWKNDGRIGNPPGPAARSTPPAPPAAEPRPADEDLRAKLLNLGSQPAVVPDQVAPPLSDGSAAGAAGDREEDDPEFDSEGQELIASLLAKGATLGLVGITNRQLRKRKPPQEGEPHEWGLAKFEQGMETLCKKIVGKTSTLGPVGQVFVGGLVIVGSMYMNAEPIDPAAAAAAASTTPAPAPAAAEPSPPPTTNGSPPSPPTTAIALGVFGVEKRSIGN